MIMLWHSQRQIGDVMYFFFISLPMWVHPRGLQVLWSYGFSYVPTIDLFENSWISENLANKIASTVDSQFKLILQCSWLQCSSASVPLFLLVKPRWLRGTGGSPDEKRETRKALGSSELEVGYWGRLQEVLKPAFGENFPCNIISTPLRVRVLFPL